MSTIDSGVVTVREKTSAEKFLARSKGCFLIRLWISKGNEETYSPQKTVHILILRTFTQTEKVYEIAGFEPFTEDSTFACEVQFSFGRKLFHLSEPNLRRVQIEDLEQILTNVPLHLLDVRDGFMFGNEDNVLIKRERLICFVALALLEQKLAAFVPPEEKGTHRACARWMICELLNRINSDSWQIIHSLVG